MTSWLRPMFHVEKPVIGMAHFPALPGTRGSESVPRHDAAMGMDGMIQRMRTDVAHLLENGVDAVMFCNEDDRPYAFHADFEAIAVMTRVITALRPVDRPFGVDFLWDPRAPLAMGLATLHPRGGDGRLRVTQQSVGPTDVFIRNCSGCGATSRRRWKGYSSD